MTKTLADEISADIPCLSCGEPSSQRLAGLVADKGFVCCFCSARNEVTDKETLASYQRQLDIARKLAPATLTPRR